MLRHTLKYKLITYLLGRACLAFVLWLSLLNKIHTRLTQQQVNVLKNTSLLNNALSLLALFWCSVSFADNNDIEFSGFARAVGGYLDTSSAEYEGYDDSVSFSEKSLLGLQADYTLNQYFSASAQVLLHSDENRESGIEWLYITYAPNDALQFNVGRLRTPSLKYSDVIDVGFAYPWVNAPQQLYSSYLFSQYEGGNARFRGRLGKVTYDIEGYLGRYNDDLRTSGLAIDVEIDTLYGGVLELNYGGFQLRTAVTGARKVEAQIEGVAPLINGLQAAGFEDIAENFIINDSVSSFLVGASYDGLKWYASAEWMSVNSDIELLAELESYYVSAGYYIDDVLLHATYASSSQSLNNIENTIPIGVSPDLDGLFFAVEELNSSFPTDNLDTITLGARWDFKTNMALKAEVSFLDGEEGNTSFFEVKDGEEGFDRQATLYQVALEWVF